MRQIMLLFFIGLGCTVGIAAEKPFFAERFDQGVEDALPKGWRLKQWTGRDHDVRLEKSNGENAVHLISDHNSFGIVKKFTWRTKDHSLIRWRWKVTELPQGGDVREKSKDDQAAQLYVVFPRFPSAINSRLVGYIWDTSAPKGGKFVSQKYSKTRYVVLESGSSETGKWISEQRNVYEDYKDLFNEEPPDADGITLMIDSDDTGSRAESYFANIEIP